LQTLTQIKEILSAAGREPNGRLGQNFLIDANLMAKLLELAQLAPADTVLEVGPATGSLTEELLGRYGSVVAVEFDRGLAEILRARLGSHPRLTVLCQDALAGKHQLAPEMLEQLAVSSSAPSAVSCSLVSNLPYNIAVPVVANCLEQSWRAMRGRADHPVVFDRLTFTVQKELAGRFLAGADDESYGPVSVLTALLAHAQAGRVLPPEAFWPRPKVYSQMVRLDFDPALAGQLTELPMLSAVLAAAFSQRRKKIIAAARLSNLGFAGEAFLAALQGSGIDPGLRPGSIRPEQYRALANFLAGDTKLKAKS
jgi:16S rRNA (adenine1518-N6/adenine1519-N6)-dimethyltransferase